MAKDVDIRINANGGGRRRRAICGTTKAKLGWWCSRDLNHEGPCAARPIPTPWGRLVEAILRRLPDRKRLVDAAEQQQVLMNRLIAAQQEARRLQTAADARQNLHQEALATIERQTQHLEAAQARIAVLEDSRIPAFGVSQVPETVVVKIPTHQMSMGPGAMEGKLDVVLNFLSDGELKAGVQNPSVTVIGHGVQPGAVTTVPTWREHDDDAEPLGVVIEWRVMVDLARQLLVLKHVAPDQAMAERAEAILAKLDQRAREAAGA